MRLTTHDELPGDAAAIVDGGIGAFNDAAAPLHEVRPLGCFARDDDCVVIGGAIGRTWGACCELQQLWVREDRRRRGLGASLLQAFHAAAEQRGCTTFYLETWSFQAPAFYERFGYRERLSLDGFAPGVRKFVMVREGAAR